MVSAVKLELLMIARRIERRARSSSMAVTPSTSLIVNEDDQNSHSCSARESGERIANRSFSRRCSACRVYSM